MKNSEMNYKKNVLSEESYIIDKDLHYAIVEGCSSCEDNFHVLMIRFLNKEEKSLVYNYMIYPKIFVYTYWYFLCYRPLFVRGIYSDVGQLLTIFDGSLVGENQIKNNLLITKEYADATIEIIKNSFYPITSKQIFDIINRLFYIGDIHSINILIDYALNKNHYKFAENLLNTVEGKDVILKCINPGQDSISINIINGCVFVVSDMVKFIKSIKDLGYNINAGPQSQRGRVSNMNNSLSQLDFEYRKSLYNHNNYHINVGNIDKRHLIDRDRFSFKNIHMNIGSVRWYSTKNDKVVNGKEKTLKGNIDYLSTCFTELITLFQTRQRNIDLQLDIEKYLFELKNAYSNSINKSNINFDQKSCKFIMGKTEDLIRILKRDYSEVGSNYGNAKWPFIRNLRLTSEIVNELTPSFVGNAAITYLLTILTREKMGKNFGMKSIAYEMDYLLEEGDEDVEDIEDIKLGYKPIREMFCYTQFGDILFDRYKYILYRNDFRNKSYNFGEWCNLEDVKKNFDRFKGIDTLTGLGGNILFILTQPPLSLIRISTIKTGFKKASRVLCIEDEFSKTMLKENVTSLPYKLPMIVKPKLYELKDGILSYGGYLLNGDAYVEDLFIKKPLYNISTKVEEPESVLQMVNAMSTVPYTINIETLDYIVKFGKSKGIILDYDRDVLPFINKDVNKFKSMLSKYSLQNIILEIGQVYSLVDEIYFPVRLDNRTRVYVDTEYFNYQSTDLAKALLLFSNYDYIYKHDDIAIKYFKSFGAVLFGGGNSRKSLNKRVDWVDANSEELLNFMNNDIISRAKDKASFVSFCFEYKRFISFMNDMNRSKFETRLPIQIDASCNGYQHLSLLTRDKKGLKYLNLNKSSFNDDPHDLYSLIVSKIRELISIDLDKGNYSSESVKESLIKILSINFTREELKNSIMTFAYNARSRTMAYYLSDKMDAKIIEGKIPNPDKNGEMKSVSQKLFYLPHSSNGVEKVNGLDWKELCLIISYLKRAVGEYIPKMNELNNYMKTLVDICVKFGIPLPRKLPTGAIINESYIESKIQKSTPIAFLNKTKYTFKVPIIDENGNIVYSKRKMSTAIMPNVVHSLDASAIALLLDFLKSSTNDFDTNNINNIYTVHDCFAMTSNNIKRLVECLKNTYIKIYSDNVYLLEMDKYVRNHIEQSLNTVFNEKGDKFKNPKTGRYIKYPNVHDVINTKISVQNVRRSSNLLI